MKAVLAEVPPQLIELRKKTGAHRYDEIWEGVWHMPPVPNREHQDLEWALETWLRLHWARPLGCRVYHTINVASPGGWPDKNYRIPDLVLLTPDRFDIDHNEYFEGAPAVVVEIRSPGDESYEKLPFYYDLGVPEVWVIDRDTRLPEIFARDPQGQQYEPRSAQPSGWLLSQATPIELRQAGDRLAIRLAGNDASQEELPEH